MEERDSSRPKRDGGGGDLYGSPSLQAVSTPEGNHHFGEQILQFQSLPRATSSTTSAESTSSMKKAHIMPVEEEKTGMRPAIDRFTVPTKVARSVASLPFSQEPYASSTCLPVIGMHITGPDSDDIFAWLQHKMLKHAAERAALEHLNTTSRAIQVFAARKVGAPVGPPRRSSRNKDKPAAAKTQNPPKGTKQTPGTQSAGVTKKQAKKAGRGAKKAAVQVLAASGSESEAPTKRTALSKKKSTKASRKAANKASTGNSQPTASQLNATTANEGQGLETDAAPEPSTFKKTKKGKVLKAEAASTRVLQPRKATGRYARPQQAQDPQAPAPVLTPTAAPATAPAPTATDDAIKGRKKKGPKPAKGINNKKRPREEEPDEEEEDDGADNIVAQQEPARSRPKAASKKKEKVTTSAPPATGLRRSDRLRGDVAPAFPVAPDTGIGRGTQPKPNTKATRGGKRRKIQEDQEDQVDVLNGDVGVVEDGGSNSPAHSAQAQEPAHQPPNRGNDEIDLPGQLPPPITPEAFNQESVDLIPTGGSEHPNSDSPPNAQIPNSREGAVNRNNADGDLPEQSTPADAPKGSGHQQNDGSMGPNSKHGEQRIPSNAGSNEPEEDYDADSVGSWTESEIERFEAEMAAGDQAFDRETADGDDEVDDKASTPKSGSSSPLSDIGESPELPSDEDVLRTTEDHDDPYSSTESSSSSTTSNPSNSPNEPSRKRSRDSDDPPDSDAQGPVPRKFKQSRFSRSDSEQAEWLERENARREAAGHKSVEEELWNFNAGGRKRASQRQQNYETLGFDPDATDSSGTDHVLNTRVPKKPGHFITPPGGWEWSRKNPKEKLEWLEAQKKKLREEENLVDDDSDIDAPLPADFDYLSDGTHGEGRGDGDDDSDGDDWADGSDEDEEGEGKDDRSVVAHWGDEHDEGGDDWQDNSSRAGGNSSDEDGDTPENSGESAGPVTEPSGAETLKQDAITTEDGSPLAVGSIAAQAPRVEYGSTPNSRSFETVFSHADQPPTQRYSDDVDFFDYSPNAFQSLHDGTNGTFGFFYDDESSGDDDDEESFELGSPRRSSHNQEYRPTPQPPKRLRDEWSPEQNKRIETDAHWSSPSGKAPVRWAPVTTTQEYEIQSRFWWTMKALRKEHPVRQPPSSSEGLSRHATNSSTPHFTPLKAGRYRKTKKRTTQMYKTSGKVRLTLAQAKHRGLESQMNERILARRPVSEIPLHMTWTKQNLFEARKKKMLRSIKRWGLTRIFEEEFNGTTSDSSEGEEGAEKIVQERPEDDDEYSQERPEDDDEYSQEAREESEFIDAMDDLSALLEVAWRP